MRKSKDVFLLLFLILSALVIGGLISYLTSGIPALNWITYGQSIGFNPDGGTLIDVQIFKFSLGFSMEISVVQILLIATALIIYRKVK